MEDKTDGEDRRREERPRRKEGFCPQEEEIRSKEDRLLQRHVTRRGVNGHLLGGSRK